MIFAGRMPDPGDSGGQSAEEMAAQMRAGGSAGGGAPTAGGPMVDYGLQQSLASRLGTLERNLPGFGATAALTKSLLSYGQKVMASGQDDLPVFVGGDPWLLDEDTFKRNQPNPDRVKTASELVSDFENLDLEKQQTLAIKLWLAGILQDPSKASLFDVQSAYADLLSAASDRFQRGKLVTPSQLLDNLIRYKHGDEDISSLVGKYRSGGFTETQEPYTRTNEVVDLTDPDTARGILKQSMSQMLGYEPDKAEFEDFLSVLHSEERDNPVLQTTHVDAEGNATTTQEGGVNAQQQAQEWVEDRPDYAEWQAVATYFPAMQQALGALPGSTLEQTS